MTVEQTSLQKVFQKGKQSRRLVLDYAIGTSILGLIPIGGILSLKFLIAIGLILKMIWDVGSIWGFPLGQDGLAIAGYLAGWLGAMAMALMAWFTFFAIGLYIPYVKSFAIAASLFTFVWIIGQATNHFFQIGKIKSYFRKIKS